MNQIISMLNQYRETVIDLSELESQLSRIGTDGRPAAYRGVQFDMNCPGTNDPAAAARQLAEGLEAMIDRKRSELVDMANELQPMLLQISKPRTMMVIQRYYCFGETDENIAHLFRITPQRVHQIRHRFLTDLQKKSS